MSLISQNVPSTFKSNKKREDPEEPAFMQASEENGDGDKLTLNVMKVGKRKKARNEADEKEAVEQEKEMKKLESFLFGKIYSPIEFGKEDEEAARDTLDDGSLFFVDRSANKVLTVDEDGEVVVEAESKQRKAVWEDDEESTAKVSIAKVNRLRKLRKEEDENMISASEYVSRLRAQHVKMNPGTEWAQLDSESRKNRHLGDDSSDDEDGAVVSRGYQGAGAVDELLRTNEDLVVKSSSKLLPGLLEYSILTDANVEEPSRGPINSVQFHRNAQLLLTAGLDKRLRFFQIDGKRNAKIESIFIDDCPIRKAAFLPDGSQVILAGRRKFFYSFDLVKAKVDRIGPLVGREEKSLETFEVSPDSNTIAFVGNEGYILLVSSKTKELIGTLKMNGTARSLAFSEDGKQLLSSGGDGHVYHWDLRTGTCFHKAVDEGCITGTSLSTSPNGKLFATGSDSGIVNIYNREEFLGGKKKPMKAIENLTTKVDFLKFNIDSQILAICSSMQKNSLKLVHVPSLTVFSNWPPQKKTLHYPRCLDFSPGGGFMAMGNASGKVMLYKLHHYHDA